MGVQTAEASLCGRFSARHMYTRSAQVPTVSANIQSVWSPLTSGRSGPPRREVVDIQRARIVAAAIDTVEDRGYADMTVAAVVERARVSRKTFYEIFSNRDECFMAVIEEIFTTARSVMSTAYAAESGWLAATRAALDSLLCLIDAEPGLARTSMMIEAIDRGRDFAGEGRRPPELAAEAAVGGISHIIHSRLTGKSSEPLAALLGPFMYLIAFPYLGAPRARAELRRRSAQGAGSQPGARRRRAEPLRGINIRLTYRTVRALGAIRAHPGASNRTVADECGIQDQGQISKLLSRLERLALIENRGVGQKHGGVNAWHITERGSQIVRATNIH
jgi:AcrR family transcriptional regulator